jgi:hypothetical protein
VAVEVPALYHLNTGLVKPFWSVTDAKGTCAPHWFEFVAVGAVGKAIVVTVTGEAVIGQPLTIAE